MAVIRSAYGSSRRRRARNSSSSPRLVDPSHEPTSTRRSLEAGGLIPCDCTAATDAVGNQTYGGAHFPFLLLSGRNAATIALDARHRASLYGKFAKLLGEDDANALMTEFPSIEADELVTKQFLRAELAELRGEWRAELGGLREELRGEITGLREELHREIGALRSDTGSLRSEMSDRFHQQTVWFGGALGASTALLAAIGLFA